MPNPLFNALGGGQPPLAQQFRRFMAQMRGKDPNQMIQQLVASGQISQEHLNQVQQRAQQMQGMFRSLRDEFQ